MMYVLAGLTLAALTLTACTLVVLVQLISSERDHAAAERALHHEQINTLLQRIQAPEQAAVDHSIAQTPEAPALVPMDDDAAQWLARGVDVSKDELADMLATESL
ncbi:MAG: hypothetical protein M3R63_18460 [Actinomycetota bacterium]|nr:hypothetical protein [Actinomycetota bacterium]